MLRNSIRKHRRLVVAAAVIGAFFLAWIAYSGLGQFTADRSYRAAAREADRLDPGWRVGIPGSSKRNRSPMTGTRRAWSSPPGRTFPAAAGRPCSGAWPPMKLDPAAPLPSELLTVLRKHRDDAAAGLADPEKKDQPEGRFPEWKVEVPRGVPISRQKVDSRRGCSTLTPWSASRRGTWAGPPPTSAPWSTQVDRWVTSPRSPPRRGGSMPSFRPWRLGACLRRASFRPGARGPANAAGGRGQASPGGYRLTQRRSGGGREAQREKCAPDALGVTALSFSRWAGFRPGSFTHGEATFERTRHNCSRRTPGSSSWPKPRRATGPRTSSLPGRILGSLEQHQYSR